MTLDFNNLEPYIEEILTAPGTDLATISAKRVRKQLQIIDPLLTPELLKEHREAVDAVIARVFERVQSSAASGSQDSEVDDTLEPVAQKRRLSENGGGSFPKEEDATDVDSPPPPKKAKRVAKQELTDAELARQLSSEINGRTRRNNGLPKAASNGSSKKKRKAKSAEMVHSDSDSGEIKRTSSKKKSREGGAARGGFAKPYLLSEPLAAVIGVESLSRPQVVKQLWAYIKANELQNPSNKKEIICDSLLKPLFNADKIDMFKMNKVLGQ